MDEEQRRRLTWVRLFQQLGDAGLVCRRCGISRPTLRLWVRRFEAEGIDGLKDRSRRPKTSPNRKIGDALEALILALRKQRCGARRIRNRLLREQGILVSATAIHRVLARHNATRLPSRPARSKGKIRYTRPVPGDRVQIDVCKIAPRLYQYTAIDDCTRYLAVGLRPARRAADTLVFLDKLFEEAPFPIQRIQTDRGREFFAIAVQERLMEEGIKFRPIKPRSPHLNGKVERANRTVLDEFWATADLGASDLATRLDLFTTHYNWQRPHSSLNGKSPIDRICELADKTPLREAVCEAYDATKERIRNPDYRIDLALAKVKGSL